MEAFIIVFPLAFRASRHEFGLKTQPCYVRVNICNYLTPTLGGSIARLDPSQLCKESWKNRWLGWLFPLEGKTRKEQSIYYRLCLIPMVVRGGCRCLGAGLAIGPSMAHPIDQPKAKLGALLDRAGYAIAHCDNALEPHVS